MAVAISGETVASSGIHASFIGGGAAFSGAGGA
jgi:hypothetical protein